MLKNRNAVKFIGLENVKIKHLGSFAMWYIGDFITLLRPFGGKIWDFAFTSLNASDFYVIIAFLMK